MEKFRILIKERIYKEKLESVVKKKDSEKRKLIEEHENLKIELKRLENERSELTLQFSDHENSFGNF